MDDYAHEKSIVDLLQSIRTESDPLPRKKYGPDSRPLCETQARGLIYESARTGMSSEGYFFLTDAGEKYLSVVSLSGNG